MAQQPDQELGQVLVVIPTYNERDNIGKIVKRLHTALPDVHVLVVDDGSPDGTGQLADEMAAASRTTDVSTFARWAPSAMCTPSSFVRRATE